MEDYIEDDFIAEEEPSTNRRPFLIAVGVLVTLFILMGICTAVFLVQNRAANGQDEERIAIETRNAETLASNAATAVAATATVEAMPTETAVSTDEPTETPEPATVTPTSTPVVEEEVAEIEDADGADDGSDEQVDADAEGDADGTSGTATDADASADGDGTDGADSGESTDGTDSAMSETGTDSGSDDALPETGFDTWGIIVAALGLVGLFIFARRLRTSG